MFEYVKIMSVVKDVDSEAMPTSIFLNDDDDDDDDVHNVNIVVQTSYFITVHITFLYHIIVDRIETNNCKSAIQLNYETNRM